ncbi:alpha/beta hydrolase [Actinomadura sp. ATCC 31491]|uniref:Alpha/beta hydrolase n=1 Tax=Actinomadura luzonensis TaxID=2805427 RepID=A0ABT0FPY9_9ACTN|nr:alpha/beta hydrolase [Actinomadura luzonensis]MCK2214356.1 alpha/beta hydrolase [Actinomadura luzonensis]
MHRVTAKDGTSIAYDRLGSGPAVVLVGGAAVDRSHHAPLAEELAAHFTVHNYDRRGRGDSDDTPPYAVEREIEDLAALMEAAGGAAHLFGVSSGGALALEAAAAGLPVARLAVYEVPYDLAEDAGQRQKEYAERLHALLAEGRRGEAFALFMRLAGTPEEMVEQAQASPAWASCEALAPTLAYDAAVMGDGRPPLDRLARIPCPTLVATGGASPDSAGAFFDRAADAVAAALPLAERVVVEGQTHLADPKALAPVLARFFSP